MLSSVSTVQSSMVRGFVSSSTTSSTKFTSFPTYMVARYDLYYESGRETSSGSKVTSDGAHIYKILDKSGNGYHMISASTDTSPSNKFLISGLGSVSKPCVSINSTTSGNTYQTTGYSVSGNVAFTDGYEMLCVMRPIDFTVSGSNIKGQNIINKYKTGSGFPNPFCIRINRVIGNGTTSSSWNNDNVNLIGTHTTGFILGSRYFKANATANGNTTALNGYAVESLNGSYNTPVNVGTTNYTDSTGVLGLGYRPVLPNQQQAFELGEMMLFSQPLSPSDRSLLEGYLATKWDIPITNTSHTYYNKTVQYDSANP